MDNIYYVEIDNLGNQRFTINTEGKRIPCEAMFKDFKCWLHSGGCLYLSEDFKTVYCHYYGDKYTFKVLNIQTKPFKSSYIKIDMFNCKKNIEKIKELKKLNRNIIDNAKKRRNNYDN